MYSWVFATASKFGAPCARKVAEHAIKLAATLTTTALSTSLRRDVMGLSFPSPIGLAAGFDKHGRIYPSLPPLGFGFAEIGSVIPLPELQRSLGVDFVNTILSQYHQPHPIPLGVSISMNRKTHPIRMADDYLVCMERLWKYSDYFTINLGVRAGPDLHMAEYDTTLHNVLTATKKKQVSLSQTTGLYRPLVVKVDINRGNTDSLISRVQEFAFDGLILSGDTKIGEAQRMLLLLEQAVRATHNQIPIISVGGIRKAQDATDRLSAGASLVQIYSGLVESGPFLPRRINALIDSPQLKISIQD